MDLHGWVCSLGSGPDSTDWEPGLEQTILDTGAMGVGLEGEITEADWCWSELKGFLQSSWPVSGSRKKSGFVGAHMEPLFAGADWEPGGHGSQWALG